MAAISHKGIPIGQTFILLTLLLLLLPLLLLLLLCMAY
jgi:hypothetical protein